MAEARAAVAFQFSVNEEGQFKLNFNKNAMEMVKSSISNRFSNFLFLFQKILHVGLFPVTPKSLVYTCLFFWLSYLLDYPHFITALLHCFSYFMPGGSTFLRMLFSLLLFPVLLYFLIAKIIQLTIRGLIKFTLVAMNSSTGDRSQRLQRSNTYLNVLTLLFKYVIGEKFYLYSFQNCLPHLSVPDLDATLNQWLESVKPIHAGDDNKLKQLKEEKEKFSKGIGQKLQYLLLLKSWLVPNYVSDWWEKYVYLRFRKPLQVNSNFYCLDYKKSFTGNQLARAANMTKCMLDFRETLIDETLQPIVYYNVVPLCSSQYSRMFNTCRLAKVEQDELVHYPPRNGNDFIVVFYRGRFFKLNFCDKQKKLFSVAQIKAQLQYIVDEVETEIKNNVECPERNLAALTGLNRDKWANIIEKHFGDGVNKYSLDVISRSAFTLILESVDEDPEPSDYNTDEGISKMARSAIHGHGNDRWFDKSFNLVIRQDAKCVFNVEHSWADAPVMGQAMEYTLFNDVERYGYDDNGDIKTKLTNAEEKYNDQYSSHFLPQKLVWQICPELNKEIVTALMEEKTLMNNLDLAVKSFSHYGKGLIKQCKTSPDAFIQLALQLAYYVDQGKFDLTYESSMVRVFRDGRTETVRSCTLESSAFVRSVVTQDKKIRDTKNMPQNEKEEAIKLFRKAANKHVSAFQQTMLGNGCDRHLFCLYVASKGLGVDVPFLSNILGEPWRLSTSQTPVGMSNVVDFRAHPEYVTPGGGFGPVADDGYGVSYIIVGEDVIFFHVSSNKNLANTDTARFAGNIEAAMLAIRDLLS